MYNCLPPSQPTNALQLFTAFLIKRKNNRFTTPKSTSTGVLLKVFIFSEMAIIQYSSLDKFSYNITEQGTSSFKSSEIQLPPRKAKNTLFRKSFAEFGFFPPPYQSLEEFDHHDSYYNVISCLTHAYTHKNSKKISRWLLPQLLCCNHFQH